MALRAFLVVASSELSGAEIRRRISIQPTYVKSIGDLAVSGRPRSESVWVFQLRACLDEHFGTSCLSHRIEALPVSLANEFRALSNEGAGCILDLVQEVGGENDYSSIGLHVSADAVGWLARAGVQISIDQYFYADA